MPKKTDLTLDQIVKGVYPTGTAVGQAAAQSRPEPLRDAFVVLAPEKIHVRSNHRKHFDEAALAELTESIRQHGVIEPLIVRVDTCVEGGRYELVAGERRLRAAKLAGLERVPCRLLQLSEEQADLIQLAENLQRQDLSPIEEAAAYKRLVERGMQQAELAAKLGVSPSTISNRIRLLGLPEDVQERISRGTLPAAAGVALCALREYPDEVRRLADRYEAGGTSTKELENIVAGIKAGKDARAARGERTCDTCSAPLKPGERYYCAACCAEAEGDPDDDQAEASPAPAGDKRYCPKCGDGLTSDGWCARCALGEKLNHERIQRALWGGGKKHDIVKELTDAELLDCVNNISRYDTWTPPEGRIEAFRDELARRGRHNELRAFDEALKRRAEVRAKREREREREFERQRQENDRRIANQRRAEEEQTKALDDLAARIGTDLPRELLCGLLEFELANGFLDEDDLLARLHVPCDDEDDPFEVARDAIRGLQEPDLRRMFVWHSLRQLGGDDEHVQTLLQLYPAPQWPLPSAEDVRGVLAEDDPAPPATSTKPDSALPKQSATAWIFNCSCSDANYAGTLPKLTDDELRYCLEREWRKSGRKLLERELKRREKAAGAA